MGVGGTLTALMPSAVHKPQGSAVMCPWSGDQCTNQHQTADVKEQITVLKCIKLLAQNAPLQSDVELSVSWNYYIQYSLEYYHRFTIIIIITVIMQNNTS